MSEIERYLDDLFDLLAGTGETGRRALAETEDHLRASVADGVSGGLAEDEAQREAVARFGPPSGIARGLRRAHRQDWLAAAFSGAWLLAGLALVMIGVAYLAGAVSIGILLGMHPEATPPCSGAANVVYLNGCSDGVPAMQSRAITASVLLPLGALVLVARWMVVRRTDLAPAARRLPWLGAAVFAATSLALLVAPGLPWSALVFEHQPAGPGLHLAIIASGVALATSLGLVAWGIVRSRRRPAVRPGPAGRVVPSTTR